MATCPAASWTTFTDLLQSKSSLVWSPVARPTTGGSGPTHGRLSSSGPLSLFSCRRRRSLCWNLMTGYPSFLCGLVLDIEAAGKNQFWNFVFRIV